jgi:DNA helicase II / ATP-dependent DNA helicase PcrA
MIDLNGLNTNQKKAAETVEGPLLILAGAGSGKTRTVTYRIAHMLVNLHIDPASVLAISFTNKAAKEMAERVRHLVGYRYRKGLTISTFHSLCLNILRSEIHHLGYSKNFTIYDTSDQMSIVREALKQFRAEKSFDKKTIMSKIGLLKNNGISPTEFANTAFYDPADPYDQATEYIYRYYQDKLHFYNAVDFDDILFLTVQIFDENPEIATKYSQQFKYIMIDEYQDTNGLQFRLVKHLTSTHSNICVVGDDDQAIYAFRGADISNILNFEKLYKNTTVIKLEENYRSTGQILDIANTVIKKNKFRKDKTMWTSNSDGQKPILWAVQDEAHEAHAIVDEIHKHQTKGGRLSDIAILYRSNNQIPPIEDQLRLSQIPYNIIGGQKFYEKKEIKDLIAYLSIILNHKDELSLRRILNVPNRGIGTKSLKTFIEQSKQHRIPLFQILESKVEEHEAKEGLETFVKNIRDFKQVFHEQNLVQGIEHLINHIHYYDYINKCYDSPKLQMAKKSDVQSFIQSAERFQETYKDEATLKNFVEKLLLADSQDRRNPAKDENGLINEVTMMTLHSSKGLEFDIVFLIGMEEDKLPHRKVIRQNEDISEERRLCYVGMTRARKKLFMSYCKEKTINNKSIPRHPSRFILETAQDLYIHQDRTMFGHMSKEEAEEMKVDFFNDLIKSLSD